MKVSKKKFMIVSLGLALQQACLNKNELILVTPLGIITGKPVFPEETKPEDTGNEIKDFCPNKWTREVIEAISKNYAESTGIKEEDKAENDGFILLENVTIRSAQTAKTSLPLLVVFYDQIVGVAIGNI